MENGFYGFPKNRTYTKPILSSSYAESASFSLTASYILNGNIDTGSFVNTSSFNLFTASFNTFTSSYNTGSFKGNLDGTASWALNTVQAISSSRSITSSFAISASQAITASYVLNAVSSSYASTASFLPTGTYNITASWAQSASQAISASYVLSSSYASTASYALNGGVTQIIAGTGVVISPSNGLGNVTVNSTAASYNTATGSYGSFYDTGSQTAVSATTIYSMSLSTTDISNGVYISGSTDPYNTYVKVTNAGVYNIQFSAQFRNAGNNPVDVTVWVRKNDGSSVNDIADSSGICTVPAKKGATPGQIIISWNYYISLAAGDFIQLLWHTDTNNDVTLETIAAGVSPTHPRTPSLILTAQRVDTFLSNTGSFSGSFTGNLIGTASWATNTLTASFLPVGTYAITASWAQSASQAITASYVTGSIHNSTNPALSASYALSASQTTNALTASFLPVGTYQITSSWANNASTASYVVTAQTASYVLSAISSSYAATASLLLGSVQNATSASYAATASFVRGAGTVIYGNNNAATIASGITTYLSFGMTSATSATEGQRQVPIGLAGTLRNLYIITNNTAPVGGTTTFTVRINGTNTSVALSIAGGSAANIFPNTTNSASVSIGDLVSLQVSASGATSPQILGYSFTIGM